MSLPPVGRIKMYHPFQHRNADGSAGSDSPESAHDLPAELLRLGWRKIWSRREKRLYFYNKNTGKSQWDMPKVSTADTEHITMHPSTDNSNNQNFTTVETQHTAMYTSTDKNGNLTKVYTNENQNNSIKGNLGAMGTTESQNTSTDKNGNLTDVSTSENQNNSIKGNLGAMGTTKSQYTSTDNSNKRNFTTDETQHTAMDTSTDKNGNLIEVSTETTRHQNDSIKRNLAETDPPESKLVENVDTSTYTGTKKVKIETFSEAEVMEKTNIVKGPTKSDTCSEMEVIELSSLVMGAMMEVIKTKVIDCLNHLCPLVCLQQDGEHVCVFCPKEDIMFCNVGLIQKYHMAYQMMKKNIMKQKEAGDCQLYDLLWEAMIQRGLPPAKVEQFCSMNVFLIVIGNAETYSKVFEQLLAKLQISKILCT